MEINRDLPILYVVSGRNCVGKTQWILFKLGCLMEESGYFNPSKFDGSVETKRITPQLLGRIYFSPKKNKSVKIHILTHISNKKELINALEEIKHLNYDTLVLNIRIKSFFEFLKESSEIVKFSKSCKMLIVESISNTELELDVYNNKKWINRSDLYDNIHQKYFIEEAKRINKEKKAIKKLKYTSHSEMNSKLNKIKETIFSLQKDMKILNKKQNENEIEIETILNSFVVLFKQYPLSPIPLLFENIDLVVDKVISEKKRLIPEFYQLKEDSEEINNQIIEKRIHIKKYEKDKSDIIRKISRSSKRINKIEERMKLFYERLRTFNELKKYWSENL